MFLSAFMIYGHSKIVISSLGDSEKELIVLSEKMIKKFEYMVFSYNQPSFYKALQEFNEIWKDFSNKFKIWKKKDSEALLEILIQHWIEMEKLWFSVKDYEAANTWQSKIVVQQRNIKKKIETLTGRSGILKLIKTTHKSRETKFPNIKFKPNVMPSPYLFPIDKNGKTTINQNSVIGPLDKSYIHDETEKFDTVRTNATKSYKDDDDENNTDIPATEKVKETEKSKEKDKDYKNENGNGNKNENENGNGKRENDSRDIDEIFVKNLLNKYNNRFSNFQLAHEIILNPEFQFEYYNENNEEEEEEGQKKANEKLSENPNNNYNNIISKVTKIAQKAFFDMVQESFDSGNENQFIPGIVKDIKDRLLFLTNKDKKTYNQVNEVLDEKLILQQIQHGETNFDNIFNFIVNTMLQLCAPVRDEAIKKIYDMEKPVQKIKGILNQLDNMKIDLANYNIKKFRPYLKEIAVDYERKKFKEAIETNLIDLKYTETWLSQSVIRIVKNQNNNNNNVKYATKDLKKKRKENQTRYIDIYNDAFLSLLFKRKIFENEKSVTSDKSKMKSSVLNNSDSDILSENNSLSNNNKSNIAPSSMNSSSTFNCSTEDERLSFNKSSESKSKKNVSYIPVLKKNDEIVLPETLMFDFNRILEYQQSIRNFSIVSSITILCQSIIPYLHGKEFIIKNIYLELLDYIENNLPQLQKKKPNNNKDNSNGGSSSSSSSTTTTTTTNNNNNNNNNMNSHNSNNSSTSSTTTTTAVADNKGESNGGSGSEEGKKKNKMDKESKLNSLMADFAKYIITKIESIILDSIIQYNSEKTNYVKLEPKILSANEKVLLKKMIINTLLLNNNMYSIINRQIMSLLLHYLKTGEFKTDTLDRFCLYYSKDKLHVTFSKIKLFTEYNRDVYSEYYDQIMAKLLIINKIYPS
ncbi:hypothetical protein H8356DRAFT_1723809 [Neocallimastix lanati (nom. inval.)]|uniref:Uncharacterized protein n=1 Tax=Neocallimastix californiae TaxID=1754190 RepID=A0A1Y2C2A8_9FUNG|nr:hypothetical protein H8356DRAFT_1723809 [Neocallimastix sp. JGI-2020a]ORY41141.1 hypothetical protein LY90DRAFT_704017 [Neocallimastix californiae]|eukprot:ORY41141.1 hypothetical protein LY90DRAFT_704017 [Neocallimastix californiae]